MNSTPTEPATRLALELAKVLESIQEHFAATADHAYRLAVDHLEFGPARQHLADAEHLADATERVAGLLPDVRPAEVGLSSRARFADEICGAIFELSQTAKIDAVLEDIDPERLAQEERIVARLVDAGEWSDDEEASRQLDIAARTMKSPAVPR